MDLEFGLGVEEGAAISFHEAPVEAQARHIGVYFMSGTQWATVLL